MADRRDTTDGRAAQAADEARADAAARAEAYLDLWERSLSRLAAAGPPPGTRAR